MKTFMYKVTLFFLENWKTSAKVLIGFYFITIGITLLAGIGSGNIALPTMTMMMPTVS